MRIFRKWRGASGLALNISKCSVIMGVDDSARYRAGLDLHPDAREMQPVRQAVYLGVNIGPEAHAHQWQAICAKIEGRTGAAASGSSIMSRVLFFNLCSSRRSSRRLTPLLPAPTHWLVSASHGPHTWHRRRLFWKI